MEACENEETGRPHDETSNAESTQTSCDEPRDGTNDVKPKQEPRCKKNSIKPKRFGIAGPQLLQAFKNCLPQLRQAPSGVDQAFIIFESYCKLAVNI
ncbi:hypothetical protein CDAR_464451 [Caerostris darwini]|uniref:Uncharacterized protein n=1 Tax=Caerostris darwini TaxID=1538125 RepID=A0AAV4VTI0_9ARAC|nr:hypothetical protein CDAR_464451 [Caerostris darwini]